MLLVRRYFCYVLVSIGWIELAGEKLGEGSLAAAECLDPAYTVRSTEGGIRKACASRLGSLVGVCYDCAGL
jgi:hypothetical protein